MSSGPTTPSPAREGIHQRIRQVGELDTLALDNLVRLALNEDIGSGDATTRAVIDPRQTARARVYAKEQGVLSGLRAAWAVVQAVDPEVRLEVDCEDGDAFVPGTDVLNLRGRAHSLLTLERVFLNFIQQLSGVASLTRKYVEAVEGTGVTIVDTRKTTPGLRLLEKEAVRHGGGGNHRIGLYDAFMVKDNHIVAAGGVREAVERVRTHGPDLYLVLEVRTPEEVEEGAALAVDHLLLDNMSPDQISQSISTIRRVESERGLSRAWIEVSGGIRLDTVRAKALPGVDLISVGALTHSARAVDLSLELELELGG